MRFDSHVERLLDATVALVNLASPGEAHGTAYHRPVGADLVRAVADATSSPERRSWPTAEEAEELLDIVPQARVVFEAADRDDLAAAAAVVNDLLASTAARPRLDPDDEGRHQLHFHGPDDGYVRGWQAGIASGLAVAIGSDLGGRLGVCDAPVCDRVYVDGSKNGTRRYCSARCQSRVKAAAHRARAH
ncbi:CGNR zinc finger domain-containing protein [Terrabacter sp. Ter38]|uniref:CGNR zinc finger domain-containing protein n=1 Tax=Terrabacter sp. Ter38 TaxID=2926030 RepID=UPI0021179C0E|nr:CGNR zinc finger domain-containing protein [Terrabacter sp. Ter38]